MAPKQSSFVEGSMNDRVSAAPPADFLDEGTSNADYERQFAMDWKPPELKFGTGNGGGGAGGGGDNNNNGYSNVPGNRNSFMSVNSGLSAFTTRTGGGGATNNKTPRGLFGKVREKLALHKSRSSWAVGGADDDDDVDELNDTDNSSAFANFPIPPVFKHKRSESMDPSTLRANNRGGGGGGIHNSNSYNNQPTTEFGVFQRDAAAANARGGGRPAPPARADSLVTALPSFDPTKRPTREEIAANYQSLLASGFFGTHAIQSTRFSPPGATLNRRSEAPSEVPSFAQRMEEEPEEDDEEEEAMSQAGTNLPPSPVRQPPPPPPPNREPPPPPPEMAMDVEEEEEEEDYSASSTPTAIPASSTAVFSPCPPPLTSSRAGDTTMSPPPLPKQCQSKPALAFSSVPYSSTRAGAEPTLTARPFRPPPVSLARFSVDSSRPRSLDVQQFARGTKRPFSSATTNGSQTSFYTHRSSYDYDPMATDGHGGIGLATTTAEEKVESGARKLVKRLRKSASKLSFRSNNSTRVGGAEGNDGGEDGAELHQPPSRTSMSSTVRRSFSWRLGASKPETSLDPHQTTSSSSSSANNVFGGFKGGSDTFSLDNSTNSSMDNFQPPLPPVHTTCPPSPPPGLPTIAASPSSTDRNRLKKREIRTRRLRRKEESNSPTKSSQPMDAMDWQHPPSPSKRPRRSDASIFLRAMDSSATLEVEDDSGSEPEIPVPVPVVAAAKPPSPPPPAEGMEGVEFSFHFPGRVRPAASANGTQLGGPLVVVPDVNRGLPSVANTFQGFGPKKSGSVRVVRGDLV